MFEKFSVDVGGLVNSCILESGIIGEVVGRSLIFYLSSKLVIIELSILLLYLRSY